MRCGIARKKLKKIQIASVTHFAAGSFMSIPISVSQSKHYHNLSSVYFFLFLYIHTQPLDPSLSTLKWCGLKFCV